MIAVWQRYLYLLVTTQLDLRHLPDKNGVMR
jgi:hypothetical protein